MANYMTEVAKILGGRIGRGISYKGNPCRSAL